jgi:uncharacterized protein (DUF58 family)
MSEILSRRSTVVILLAIVSFLFGLVTGRDLLFTITYLLGLLLVLSALWSWANLNWIHLSRVTRVRRTQVGRPLEERFTVRNTSILPKLWLEVHDFSDLPAHYASQVVNGLGSKQSFSWRANTICQQRGRYTLGPVRLRTSDPFGLFPLQRDLPQTTNVVVFPMTFDIHQFALPVGILPGGDALRRRTHYITTNASGVRDYEPGDSFNRIHWRSTARRDRLVVKEFELDPLADIWVVPDMSVYGHVTPPKNALPAAPAPGDVPAWLRMETFELPESTEEYTVTIAASVAQFFLRHDRAVGMMAYGQSNEVLQPDRGERQFNRILETLAVLRAQGDVPLQDMLHAESYLFPRGTTVIVVTPMTREEWATAARQLTRRGLRVVTILVNPGSFHGSRAADKLYYLLQAQGQVAYMVNNGDDLTSALSRGKTQAGYFTV